MLCLILIEMAYGQWGNLAGYIYRTALYYALNPPDTRTPQEIHQKIKEEENNEDQEGHATTSTEKRTDTDEDTEDKNEEDEEDKPNDSAD